MAICGSASSGACGVTGAAPDHLPHPHAHIVIAYFSCATPSTSSECRGVYAAVIGIIAMVDVPIWLHGHASCPPGRSIPWCCARAVCP